MRVVEQTGTSTLSDGIRGREIVLGLRSVSVLFHICSMFSAAPTRGQCDRKSRSLRCPVWHERWRPSLQVTVPSSLSPSSVSLQSRLISFFPVVVSQTLLHFVITRERARVRPLRVNCECIQLFAVHLRFRGLSEWLLPFWCSFPLVRLLTGMSKFTSPKFVEKEGGSIQVTTMEAALFRNIPCDA